MNIQIEQTADLLCQPDQRRAAASQLAGFMRYCEQRTGLAFAGYAEFEAFAIDHFRRFWGLFLDWSGIICEGERQPVCVGDDCETAIFFPALRLNYAENLLREGGDEDSLVVGCHAEGGPDVLCRAELRDRVIRLASFLRQLGVEPGDRVAAIARNNIEVIIAALATTAIGAVFSSCSHDMGAFTTLSRLQRVEPKILFANCAAKRWDIGQPQGERIQAVVSGLPSLVAVISLDNTPLEVSRPVHMFADAFPNRPSSFVWQRFPFDHPLFILFSSGTTGMPKCIVHGTGGTLLEHVKEHRLHGDLDGADRMFFQTSCGWMMWNWQLSALACGADVLVYDGPLTGPETLWKLVSEQRITVFGTNPAYIQFVERAGYAPNSLPLPDLRAILSTGSILEPMQFEWIVEKVKRVPVQSISGGTDILGCFVLGNPLLPVYRGQLQCRSLGLDVRSLPAEGLGELICANPFPSRPTGFHGEASNARYHEAYFAQNPGVWTHGDLIEFTPHGAIMHGRSDAVLNIRGVRVGPAEIYRILRQIPVIVEAMAVEQADENEPGGARLILLVVLRAGVRLDDALICRVRTILAEQGSLLMVPAAIVAVDELPVTYSGKRSEAAARDAVNARAIRNRAALLNPECLDALAGRLTHRPPATHAAIAIDEELENRLCAICQTDLNVSVVRPLDNYLALGGDSLAILTFLLNAAQATRTTLPLATLIGVSTVADLARLIRTGDMPGRADSGGAAPQIRAAERRDEAKICRLLDEAFVPSPTGGPAAARQPMPWSRLFDHPWQDAATPRGFVLVAGEEIVGFIGLICTERSLHGKAGLVCNLSWWYVRPAYRGWSAALLATATERDDVTFTSLTPMPASRPMLNALGFSALDTTKLFLPPLLHLGTLAGRRPALIHDLAEMRDTITDQQRRILDDHAGCDCLPMLLKAGEDTAFMMFRRRLWMIGGRKLLPYSEMVHCSAPALMHRHLERVKLAAMWRQRTLGVSVSRQLLPSVAGITIRSETLFRSRLFSAAELDKLYSELVLFPL